MRQKATSIRKLSFTQLQVVLVSSVIVFVLDQLQGTNWTVPVVAGGLLMAAEVYLFETLAWAMTSPPEEGAGMKKLLVLLLIPFKFLLFLVPVALYWDYGKAAIAPFCAGCSPRRTASNRLASCGETGRSGR